MLKLIDRYIAKIDSSSTMVHAAGNFLRGRDIAGLGFVPTSRLLGAAVNIPPKFLRQYVYIRGGRMEATPAKDIPGLRSEGISRWVVEKYPKRTYPAVMVGSSNGALVHLCAALGIPWLAQTVLVPVRRERRMDPDELIQDAREFREPARLLLEKNPDLQVNQMHDPIQDRLMVQQMGYFRVKKLRLGETYERFLTRCLPRGGTVLVSECTYSWPMTRLGPRHFFQTGGYGGLGAQEYCDGSRRVSEFLRLHKSSGRKWELPPLDVERPESEWGFEPELLADLRRLAKRRGWKVRRIVYEDPAAPSPWIADLYRWWYEQRGLPSSRLLAESFLLLDPWWCLKMGAIPFWKVFNTGCSADELRRYIRERGPFDEIFLTLFANSIKGIDQTPIAEWRSILRKARTKGTFVGIAEASYPYDLGVYFRFHADLQRKIRTRLPMPKPLALEQVLRFKTPKTVRWLD